MRTMERTIATLLEDLEALPKADIGDVLAGQRALILAPHADDESLGCGGLIAAATAAGRPPVVVVMTDGAASHPGSAAFPPARLREIREAEASCAVSLLGLPRENLLFLGYKDSFLPSRGADFDLAVTHVKLIAAENDCAILIAPWQGDPHCDHQAAARIAASAAARGRLALLSYPVWGWLRDGAELVCEPRRGGWRLDITAHQHAKRHAIAAHASQHGALITDSPTGFRLPRHLLDVFARPFEVFIA